nr:ubiquitin-conjugating enzyme E2 R1 [Loxodonta africana]
MGLSPHPQHTWRKLIVPGGVGTDPASSFVWLWSPRGLACLPCLALHPSQARLKFPIDYPYSPPAFRFLTKMWHPNIYETGDVCISILHPPVDDPQSGELPSERWNPTQNVRSQETPSPCLSSPSSKHISAGLSITASVSAVVVRSNIRMCVERPGLGPLGTLGGAGEMEDHVGCAGQWVWGWRWQLQGVVGTKPRSGPHLPLCHRKQVLGTKVDAERDGVKVPTTLAEYCVKTKAPAPDEGSDLFYDDYYEDGEVEEGADSCFGDDEDDSGTEES